MTITEVIIRQSRGAELIERTTKRRFRKPIIQLRCACPFLCDACIEPCEFDEINQARKACRDAWLEYTIGSSTL